MRHCSIIGNLTIRLWLATFVVDVFTCDVHVAQLLHIRDVIVLNVLKAHLLLPMLLTPQLPIVIALV